ncbi:P-loop containing nucleoside triphosphate hydrolase protein [Sordaria sp. MPI-SDFR-AT-0083]|nr:P-loop containing nucleoside triphosphate hydrolase protein [Sordaria sp. MPI-SDFR-AT-0083]
MTANPPTEKDITAKCRTTLIVVPSSSLNQWKREIAKHTFFKEPLVFKGSHANGTPLEMMSDWDIILTTYTEVMAGYPSKNVIETINQKDLSEDKWKEEVHKNLSKLFKINFYRVVLDEAHLIRNAKAQTSKACCNLSSKQANSEFLGRPILDIPKCYPTKDIWVSFSKEESIIYTQLEAIFREHVNKELARLPLDDDEDQEQGRSVPYLKLFAFLSYLRQLTAHVFVAERLFENYWSREDIQAVLPQLEEIRETDQTEFLVEQLQAIHDRKPANDNDDEGLRGAPASPTEVFKMAKVPYIEKLLLKLADAKGVNSCICRICGQLPESPHLSKCGHAYCLSCFTERLETEMQGKGKESIKCLQCGTDITTVQLMVDSPGGSRQKRTGRRTLQPAKPKREYGDDVNFIQPREGGENSFLKASDKYGYVMVESAKVDAVMSCVLKWQKSRPNDKIIIFTQWRVMGSILGRKLQEEDIPFLYHFGDMALEQRNEAIYDFDDKPEIKVLWNSQLERQAFARVYRIGQLKRTHMVRILTKSSIDLRLDAIQKLKEEICDKALNGDKTARHNLSFHELVSLFGVVNTDARGRMEVTEGASRAGDNDGEDDHGMSQLDSDEEYSSDESEE